MYHHKVAHLFTNGEKYWRRGRDSNPRGPCEPYALSRRACSSTPAPLQHGRTLHAGIAPVWNVSSMAIPLMSCQRRHRIGALTARLGMQQEYEYRLAHPRSYSLKWQKSVTLTD